MMSGFLTSFKNVFFWDPRENGLLGILRCAMLFNFLFLLQQFGLNPYFFIFLQVIVACLFIKYCKFSMWSKQCLYHRLILSLLTPTTISILSYIYVSNHMSIYVSFYLLFLYVTLTMQISSVFQIFVMRPSRYLQLSSYYVSLS